jgi:F-box/leucine-rich repeat protein 10/11
MAPTYATNGDSIISSIEQQAEGDMPVDDLNFSGPNRGAHGPSIEPLTPGPPGPPPHNDTIHVEKNGYPVSDTIHVQINGFASRQPPQSNAVRHPSSPVSPRQMSTMSPGAQNYDAYMTSPSVNNHNNYNHFTTNSDFPPPLTPTAHPQPSSRSYAKPNQTPSRSRSSRTPKSTPNGRRRDSKDSIKLEAGFGAGMGMGMDMLDLDMIDPSLDQASIELIKQLQKEEHGLRRRSRD